MTRGVLVIGAGGLSCPVLSVLAESGVTRVTLVDDDRVELSNLQRQTLYEESDVGQLKIAAAARLGNVHGIEDRFVPDNAIALVAGHALVIEGSDNYATKFLAADAARLSGVPIVQAGAVRFSGWAFASDARGPCLRCLFEDVPAQADTCASAGVLGPVVGVVGALQAALALELLRGRGAGSLWSYDALGSGLRKRAVRARNDCPLCSGQVRDVSEARYLAAASC
ncbi:MAG TPA: ThiF family adenylyltransferase [Polyangiales bacterium]|nr:ThiF family adenylyltransferase [Polyangiales bacterium]